MRYIAVTGGIGAGKSSFLEVCQRHLRGVVTWRADEVVRALSTTGGDAYADLCRLFPAYDSTGGRAQFADRVLSDSQFRRRVERVLHPRVRRHLQKSLQRAQAQRRSFFIAEIPLLYEVRWRLPTHRIIAVHCPTRLRRARLRQRGFTEARIDRLERMQLAPEKKARYADQILLATNWRRLSLGAKAL